MGKLRPKVYLLPESVFKNSNACLQLSFSCVSLCKFLLLSQKSTVVSLFNTSFSSTAAPAFMFKDYQLCTALVNSLVVVSRTLQNSLALSGRPRCKRYQQRIFNCRTNKIINKICSS